MYDKLVIVESPSKSKTIENYLGKEYHVLKGILEIYQHLVKKG